METRRFLGSRAALLAVALVLLATAPAARPDHESVPFQGTWQGPTIYLGAHPVAPGDFVSTAECDGAISAP